MNRETKAYISAVLQVLIIGFSFLFVKIALEELTPLEILVFRFIAASIAVLFAYFTSRNRIPITKDIVKNILPLTILYPIMFFGFQAYGLVYATSSEGGITHALTPVMTTIFSALILKEKTKPLQNVMIGVSIFGLIFLTYVNSKLGSGFNILGVILLVISIISLALNTVFARKFTRRYSFKNITAVTILFGTLFFVLVELIFNGSEFINSFKALGNIKVLISILYLGVLGSYASSLLNNYALTTLQASKVAILSNITPIITIKVGVLILKEPFSIYHLIGIIITLIGVFGANYFGKEKKI